MSSTICDLRRSFPSMETKISQIDEDTCDSRAAK